MTRLLVSVQNVAEALIAREAGADLIDIKNPRFGSLGAAVPEVVRAIYRAMDDWPLTMALGDLPLWPGTVAFAVTGALATVPRVGVKIGLQGPYQKEAVDAVWQALATTDPARVIPAVYLDHLRETRELVDLARLTAAHGFPGMVWDTFSKETSWAAHLSEADLRQATAYCHRLGLWVGLAGHLRLEHLPVAVKAGVDIVGVRSAVAQGGQRSGSLDGERVWAFARELRRWDRPRPAEKVGRL
ncbi:MAG: (5-formylfuran-3-yl)methyl phosphate synthase [Firmicutes bacterium]|nr:(5-formylfuran-3-yl)methyl phosphate synthase [Bacillota bacterium]